MTMKRIELFFAGFMPVHDEDAVVLMDGRKSLDLFESLERLNKRIEKSPP